MSKTNIERIETLQEKIQQLENERKRLLNVQKEADRKARTRRLIERGAILESLISDADSFSNDQIKAFLEKTVQSDFAKRILDGLTAQKNETTAEKPLQAVKNNNESANGKTAITERGGR